MKVYRLPEGQNSTPQQKHSAIFASLFVGTIFAAFFLSRLPPVVVASGTMILVARVWLANFFRKQPKRGASGWLLCLLLLFFWTIVAGRVFGVLTQ